MSVLGSILIIVALVFFIYVYRVEKERDRLKYILPLIFGFACLGVFLIFRERIIEFTIPFVGTIKTVTQETLKGAEQVEQIRKTVLAQGETIGLVAKHANELQPQVSRVNDEIKKFEYFLNDMKDNLQKEYQTISEEIAHMRIRIYLPVLGDKAISEGDGEAFAEIIRIEEAERENSPLKKVEIEQITRIKDSFSEPSSFIGPSLTVTLEDGTIRKGADIPTDRLMMNLSDSDWKVRAEAAILLGLRTEKGVPNILLQVARTDKNLWVVYHAFVSFGYVTRQVKRPRLAGGTPITLPQGIHMFDIDKLEQWWQEHSAEVNERLADMK